VSHFTVGPQGWTHLGHLCSKRGYRPLWYLHHCAPRAPAPSWYHIQPPGDEWQRNA